MAKKEPEQTYKVGDKLQVKLHDGRIVDPTVRAIVDDGEKLQVDFGHEETALAKLSQVLKPNPNCPAAFLSFPRNHHYSLMGAFNFT